MSLEFGPEVDRREPRLEVPVPVFPPGLESAADLASMDLNISRDLIEQDYYMHKALHAVVHACPRRSSMLAWRDGLPVNVGGWAFAGGTSLVSGHALVERFSEDIDLVVYVTKELGRTPQERACRDIRDIATAAITASDSDTEVVHSGATVKTAEVNVPGSDTSVRVDVGPTFEPPHTRVFGTVVCLVGRYADARTLAAHPELCLTDVPLVPAETTAANKLATLHGRAVHDDLVGLSQRGRDVYDLAALAQDRGIARRIGEEAARRAVTGEDLLPAMTPWWASPRPAGGYAASPAFDPATAAYAALEEAYGGERARGLLWERSRRFTFDEAIAAIVGLDPQHSKGGA